MCQTKRAVMFLCSVCREEQGCPVQGSDRGDAELRCPLHRQPLPGRHLGTYPAVLKLVLNFTCIIVQAIDKYDRQRLCRQGSLGCDFQLRSELQAVRR
jgi:hypothetical protein